MNPRNESITELKIDKENNPPDKEAKCVIHKLFSAEKLAEMELFKHLRELDNELKAQNLNLLLAARLTSIDAGGNRRAVRNYLSGILTDLGNIFQSHEAAITDYLRKTLKNENSGQVGRYVLVLAQILRDFKSRIMQTGLLSEAAGVFDSDYNKNIKAKFDWSAYLQVVISTALTKMKVDSVKKNSLIQFATTLGQWHDLVYQSIQKNFTAELASYEDLKIRKNVVSLTNSHFFNKKRGAEKAVAAPNSLIPAETASKTPLKKQATAKAGVSIKQFHRFV